MRRHSPARRLLVALLAAASFAVSAATSAHEYDHVVAPHDTACALHLYAGHGGAVPTFAFESGLFPRRTLRLAPPAHGIFITTRPSTPPARGPPLRT
jgi:hypothetical protein